MVWPGLAPEIDVLGEQGTTVAQLAPAFWHAIALECEFLAAALFLGQLTAQN